MSSSSPEKTAAGEQRIPSWQRILMVFYAPEEAFEEIARAPHFILCLALQLATAAGATWYAIKRIGAMTIALQGLRSSPAAQSLTRAQISQQAATAARFIGFAWLIAALGLIAVWLILAAILLAAENFGLGQQVNYKQMLGITAHGTLPLTALYWLTAAIVAMTRRPARLNAQNLVGSNLGFYFSPHAAPWLLALGQRVDLFIFWALALLALGLQKAGTRVKYGTALGLMILLWAFWALAITGFTAALRG